MNSSSKIISIRLLLFFLLRSLFPNAQFDSGNTEAVHQKASPDNAIITQSEIAFNHTSKFRLRKPPFLDIIFKAK
jgi:hypothetical protein